MNRRHIALLKVWKELELPSVKDVSEPCFGTCSRQIGSIVSHMTGPAGAGPGQLYWKVRNGGQEAVNCNQLRGEISRDQELSQKTEQTSYSGHHYVECYLVKDGIVVASDRRDVVTP